MSSNLMPTLFIGHGSPMNAIEDNEDTRSWAVIAERMPRPKAILCVSAHWWTRGTWALSTEKPRTIHDFGGFPRALFEQQYPAPGAPTVAARAVDLLSDFGAQLDDTWGLDHGTWSVLMRMYPEANIPVFQLSLDGTQPPAHHLELGARLKPLREEGVLILGSGNIVHNLGLMQWGAHGPIDGGTDWAEEFDRVAAEKIRAGDFDALVNYEQLTPGAQLAVPTPEHYLPLLYALGAGGEGGTPEFFTERLVGGSISMRSVLIS